MFDARGFLDEYGIEYENNRNFYNVQCPFCDDRSKHLGVPKKGYTCTCFRCGKHSLFSTVKELLGLQPKNINEILKKYDTLSDDVEEVSYQNETITVPGGKLTKGHKLYLESRNYDADYLERKYDLRGTLATGDAYAYRIITPIYYNNRIVSYQGRDYTGRQEARYMTCKPEFEIIHHKKILFNLDNCKQDSVIVCEGVYDAFRFGNDCCCTFGTGYKGEQVNLLAKRFTRVFLMYDPEPEAQERARVMGDALSLAGIDVQNILLNNGKDPGDQSEQTVKELKKDLCL